MVAPTYTFPQDRDAFFYSGPGEPIRQPGEVSVRIYTSQDATTLAVIKDLSNAVISGSMLVIGEDGLLPQFKGASGVTVLWAKVAEDDFTHMVEARFAERIDPVGVVTATLNFPSIPASTAAEMTVSLTGVLVGDQVLLGPPATIEAGLVWCAYVSTTSVVKIRLGNITGSAIDPASADWTVKTLR